MSCRDKEEKVEKRKHASDEKVKLVTKKKKSDGLSEEAKQEKLLKNKAKRETEKVRSQALFQRARDILEPEGPLGCRPENPIEQCQEPRARDLQGCQQMPRDDIIQKIEDLSRQVKTIDKKLDIFLDCKDCMRKAYKGIERKKQTEELAKVKVASPVASYKKNILQVATPVASPVASDKKNILQEELSTDTPAEDGNFVKESGDLSSSGDSSGDRVDNDELAYVGDARYAVKVKKVDLERCRASSKSADKLALNLLEFILSKEEIKGCTLYGNKQHGLAPIREEKRLALKSEIFNKHLQQNTQDEKAKEWARITVVINDKIRKLRKKIVH